MTALETTPKRTEAPFIDALGPGGAFRAHLQEEVTDADDEVVARLSIVPRPYITRVIRELRAARPLPYKERVPAMHAAAELFLEGTIAGLEFEEYVELAARAAGVPLADVRNAALGVPDALRYAEQSVAAARPVGSALDWREEQTRTGSGVWVRRGEVMALHASGNSPGVHYLWVQALVLGYRAVVRPSRREPFTGQRLLLALGEAGFGDDQLAYLPTDYAGADQILRQCDLAVMYGGEALEEQYAADPSVFVNGPGRTKVLITAECDWREHLDSILESITMGAGALCACTTSVLYEGDPEPLANALAERLAAIPVVPPGPESRLPSQPLAAAEATAQHLANVAAGTKPILGADQVVAPFGEKGVLRPALHLLSAPDLRQLNTELAFPCVWVSPWSRSDGIAPLRRSLVLNAITTDADLLDQLIVEPTITNLYNGVATTTWEPQIPHDGYFADFLMRNKGSFRQLAS